MWPISWMGSSCHSSVMCFCCRDNRSSQYCNILCLRKLFPQLACPKLFWAQCELWLCKWIYIKMCGITGEKHSNFSSKPFHSISYNFFKFFLLLLFGGQMFSLLYQSILANNLPSPYQIKWTAWVRLAIFIVLHWPH